MEANLPQTSSGIRRYSGEYLKHEHQHVQIMFALQGRMELEIGGRSAFADTSCGIVIPGGVAHGFLASKDVRMFVVDVATQSGIGSHGCSFAVTPVHRQYARLTDASRLVAQVLQAPRILARRGIELARLDAALDCSLHEDWSTARMAQMFYLSSQRFHARLIELTGMTPQVYVRARRFRAAEAMLRRGVPLDTTAQQVGYRSASALSFALKRDRHFSVRQWRAVSCQKEREDSACEQ